MSDPSPRIVVVAARWNEMVVDSMIEGATAALKERGIDEFELVRVPGCWEIPVIISERFSRGEVNGAVALGCIMKGETMHAELLATDVSRVLMDLQLAYEKPIGWGVLTPENLDQALERAEVGRGNKGREAVQAVLETLEVLEPR